MRYGKVCTEQDCEDAMNSAGLKAAFPLTMSRSRI
jgi:hypothetical protein